MAPIGSVISSGRIPLCVAIVLTIGLSACAAHEDGAADAASPLTAALTVEVAGGRPLGHLRICNVSVGAHALDRRLIGAPLGEEPGPTFQHVAIRHDGEEVLYTGPVVRMAGAGPEDLLRLEPGACVEGVYDLGSYDYAPGRHDYVATYSVLHPQSLVWDDLLDVTSPGAAFVYDAP